MQWENNQLRPFSTRWQNQQRNELTSTQKPASALQQNLALIRHEACENFTSGSFKSVCLTPDWNLVLFHTNKATLIRPLSPGVTDGCRRARGHGTNTSVYFESHAIGSGACFRFTWRNQIKPFTHINHLRAWDITDHKPQNKNSMTGPNPALQLFKECFAKVLLCNF